MSIDAVVVRINDSHEGPVLILEARDEKVAPAGQRTITLLNGPLDWRNTAIAMLLNKPVWGGASDLMFGDVRIAFRDGYSAATLVLNWQEKISFAVERFLAKTSHIEFP